MDWRVYVDMRVGESDMQGAAERIGHWVRDRTCCTPCKVLQIWFSRGWALCGGCGGCDRGGWWQEGDEGEQL